MNYDALSEICICWNSSLATTKWKHILCDLLRWIISHLNLRGFFRLNFSLWSCQIKKKRENQNLRRMRWASFKHLVWEIWIEVLNADGFFLMLFFPMHHWLHYFIVCTGKGWGFCSGQVAVDEYPVQWRIQLTYGNCF